MGVAARIRRRRVPADGGVGNSYRGAVVVHASTQALIGRVAADGAVGQAHGGAFVVVDAAAESRSRRVAADGSPGQPRRAFVAVDPAAGFLSGIALDRADGL